jgi:hypothetical protein
LSLEPGLDFPAIFSVNFFLPLARPSVVMPPGEVTSEPSPAREKQNAKKPTKQVIMNILNRQHKFAVLCASMVAGFGLSILADTNAPPPIPAESNPNGGWAGQLTADYFRYDANYTPDVSQSTSVQLKGNMYGGTLSLKAPGMQPDEFIDLSGRFGKMTGNLEDLYGGISVPDTTHLFEVQALYRYGLVNRNTPDPKWKLDLLLGLDYQQWNSTEIAPPGYWWTASGTRTLLFHQSMGMVDFGLGANWYWWTLYNSDHSSRFRMGLRGEALGGIGCSAFYDGYNPDASTDVAFSAGGKGVLYTDYKFGRWMAVLEGGWQYTEYWYIGNSQDKSQNLYGPYVRLGLGCSF